MEEITVLLFAKIDTLIHHFFYGLGDWLHLQKQVLDAITKPYPNFQ